MSLDLETGDEERAEELTARERRRQARREGSSSKSSTKSEPKKRRESPDDSSLIGRLTDLFQRIAEQLRERDDDELASAIAEDSGKMAKGLVSLTKGVPVLRTPLVVIVGFIEPLLAFYRVGAILFRRFMERRQARWQAAEQTQDPYYPAAGGEGAGASVYAG